MSHVTSGSSDKIQKIKGKKFVVAKFPLCCYKYVRPKKKFLMSLLILIRKMGNKLEKLNNIFLGKSLQRKNTASSEMV